MKTLTKNQLARLIREEIIKAKRERIVELSTGHPGDAYPDDDPRCPECDGQLDFDGVCKDPHCGRGDEEFFCPDCGTDLEVHDNYVYCDGCGYEAELTKKHPVEQDYF